MRSKRAECTDAMSQRGVSIVFQYVRPHSSPSGQKFGRAGDDLSVTLLAAEH